MRANTCHFVFALATKTRPQRKRLHTSFAAGRSNHLIIPANTLVLFIQDLSVNQDASASGAPWALNPRHDDEGVPDALRRGRATTEQGQLHLKPLLHKGLRDIATSLFVNLAQRVRPPRRSLALYRNAFLSLTCLN